MPESLTLLGIAAWLHLFQVPGTYYLGRRLLDIPGELRRLSALVAAVIGVLGIAVVTVLVALGILIGLHRHEVLGSELGRDLVCFLAAFWGARLLVQHWYFFSLPWPRTRRGIVAHWTLVTIFFVQTTGYAVALAKG